MRTAFLAFSTLIVLAACAQDGTTTPGSQSRSPNAGASQDAAPAGQAQPTGNGKPTSFSTITQVTSDPVGWDGVNKIYGAAVATCPAGAHVTGGGYVMYGGPEVSIGYNGPFGEAWRIYGVSHSSASITAYALCAQ